MGFLDKFKDKDSAEMIDRAKEEIAKRDEDIEVAIDRVADLADKATDGKHTEKIEQAAEKLKEAADRLDDEPRA